MPSRSSSPKHATADAQSPHAELIDGVTRRNSRQFPLLDPIAALKKWHDIDYDFYARRPQGHRTPEDKFAWSLCKGDWFWIKALEHVVYGPIGRSTLNEMGLSDRQIGLPSEDDMAEATWLSDKPMRLQEEHQVVDHNSLECYWPEMTSSPDYVPVLDRSLDGRLMDSLVVHDPDDVTHLHPSAKESRMNMDSSSNEEPDAINYIRVDPQVIGVPWVPLPPNGPKLVGHLHLSFEEKVGVGNSATAFDAKLDLPFALVQPIFRLCYRRGSLCNGGQLTTMKSEKDYNPQESDYIGNPHEPGHRRQGMPTRFRVVAKVTATGRTFQDSANNEARSYSRMPSYLSEQWTGHQVIPPIELPQPAAAVVPLTFGYYVPDVRYSKLSNGKPVSILDLRRLSPILLLENCGTQMEVDMSKIHVEHKERLYTMMTRLHQAGFTQGSIYQRNWVVQPGPLSVVPTQRSFRCPSFRMIDFGRSVCAKDKSAGEFLECVRWDHDRLQSFTNFLDPKRIVMPGGRLF